MDYLSPTTYLDYNHTSIQALIADYKEKTQSDKAITIALYTKIRDDWRYDPYSIGLTENHYKASTIAEKNTGNCVEKSILLIACLRALNIPARIHLGKVKNHIAVERLTEKFGTNELTPHGMVNVQLEGKWLKLSPAFNQSLCHRFGVPPLDFDGENDSYLQQFNDKGDLFMEYLDDYGHFEDIPLAFMFENIKAHYPHIFDTGEDLTEVKI